MLPYFRPISTLPTVVLGYIYGDARLEDRRGNTILSLPKLRPLIWFTPVLGYAFTHLQKYSKFGFLLTWPFCFHVWYSFKQQDGDDFRGWIPGSEKVFYARTPGYRKDIEYGMKWTWGFCGLHWD